MPPVAECVNTTLKPATGLLFTSRTMTEGAATAEPAVAVCDVALLARKLVALPAVAVAVKVTTPPVSGPLVTVAVSVLAPAVVGMVHDVNEATPDAFVVAATEVAAVRL